MRVTPAAMQPRGNLNISYAYILECTVQKLKKKLHLPSPFAKTDDLFWPDFRKLHFFVDQAGAI